MLVTQKTTRRTVATLTLLMYCIVCRPGEPPNVKNQDETVNHITTRDFCVMGFGGKPLISTNESNWTSIDSNILAGSRKVIKTDNRSVLTLRNYYYGTLLHMYGDTILTMIYERDVNNTNAITIKNELQTGRINGIVKRTANTVDYECIIANNIRVRINGSRTTEFGISSSGEVCVYAGKANVFYSDEKAKTIIYSVTKNKAFLPPQNGKRARVGRIPTERDESHFFLFKDNPIKVK